jgi:hypothetical protein
MAAKTRPLLNLLARPVAPSQLLSQIRPHRRILAACSCGDRVGLALSDVYFSHATPLETVHADAFAPMASALLATHSVGALALSLPVLSGVAGERAARADAAGDCAHERLLARLAPMRAARGQTASLPCTLLSARVFVSEVRALAVEQPELWEDVAHILSRARGSGASLAAADFAAEQHLAPGATLAEHAAIGLNAFLWIECEGWARNTFG